MPFSGTGDALLSFLKSVEKPTSALSLSSKVERWRKADARNWTAALIALISHIRKKKKEKKTHCGCVSFEESLLAKCVLHDFWNAYALGCFFFFLIFSCCLILLLKLFLFFLKKMVDIFFDFFALRVLFWLRHAGVCHFSCYCRMM